MGRKIPAGLIKQGKIWHIDKTVGGQRICKSCETTDLKEAEKFLNKTLEENRKARLFGDRPSYTFEKAAMKFIEDFQHKRSIRDDIGRLKKIVPVIGDKPIHDINMATLQPWIEMRMADAVSGLTINHGLQVIRRILRLATNWVDPKTKMTWLKVAPTIVLLTEEQVEAISETRGPYTMDWSEQDRLFVELPYHLEQMSLFAVNTGCRDAEICALEWKWEIQIPQLDTSVFLVPKGYVKNKSDRLVVLNRTAKAVIERCRGAHPTHVFVYKDGPITRMNNSAWRRARTAANLPGVRVHDLKHTYGRRLRAAGVSFEDRQDLLGHRSSRITTHYSAAELQNLLKASNSVAEQAEGRPELVMLDLKAENHSRKIHVSKRTLTLGNDTTD